MQPECRRPGHFQPQLDSPELARLDWRVIDDGVMGGRSRGRVSVSAGGLRFSGQLSTENNGGFSSVRGCLPHPRPGLLVARLYLRGDGRRYQFRLRETDEPDAPAWRAFFATTGEPQRVELPGAGFEAVIRGRRLEVLPGLRERTIRYVGLMLTSADEGPFRLDLERLELLYDTAHGD